MVSVHRSGHAQAGHRVLHRPRAGVVQDPQDCAGHVRGHVRDRHARGHHDRYAAHSIRNGQFRQWVTRYGGRHFAGAGRRHPAVRRVLRGTRQTQTVRVLTPVGNHVWFQLFVGTTNDE